MYSTGTVLYTLEQRLGSGYGSGSRRPKMTYKIEKNEEISCFEVLDVLF
jgi:hypothetical protein